MYLDLGCCFFLISIAVFLRNFIFVPSGLDPQYRLLIKIIRQISPFLLNFLLKPLYSTLGGLTILADPLAKKPTGMLLRNDPLYK